MKIKKSITDTAKISVENCRMALTSSVIELCKETGIDPSIDIQFTKTLIIHTTKAVTRNGRFSHYETQTILASSISWSPEHDFFMVKQGSEYCLSSDFMTLDALCIIFEEMKNVLKKL